MCFIQSQQQAAQQQSAQGTPDWGNRPDGTKKGNGWLGVLQRPDGGVSTEISTGVEWDGQEHEIPLIVPGLDKKELDYLLTTDIHSKDFYDNMPRSIMDKAVAHAKKRIGEGKSPYAD